MFILHKNCNYFSRRYKKKKKKKKKENGRFFVLVYTLVCSQLRGKSENREIERRLALQRKNGEQYVLRSVRYLYTKVRALSIARAGKRKRDDFKALPRGPLFPFSGVTSPRFLFPSTSRRTQDGFPPTGNSNYATTTW